MSRPPDNLSAVEVSGTKLAYRDSGRGEPLVLVHGHISDFRTWSVLEERLASRFHVYVYSKRFAWPNEPIKDNDRQSWEQDSLDLAALIETLDIGPVHVLGNSSGATNALWLARSKPHLFRTLLLEEPPLITLFLPTLPPTPLSVLSFLVQHPISFWPVTIYGATTIGPAQEQAKKGDFEAAFTTFATGCLGPKFWPRAQADPARMAQMRDNLMWLGNFMRFSSLPKFQADDARGITVPTLVLTGMEGPYFAQCIDHEFTRLCGARRKKEVKVEGAGHLVHEDNPDKVIEEVIKFVFDTPPDS